MKELCERSLLCKTSMLVLGRGLKYSTAPEAALKIIEVSYIHCEAIRSGELKHGILTLVGSGLSVIIIATKDASFTEL